MTATEMPVGDVSLGDFLSDVTSQIPDDTAPEVSASDDTPGGEGPTEVPGPGEQPAETPGGEEGGVVDAANPYKMTEDGSGYVVPKSELASMTGMKDYASKVQEWFPTPADAEYAANEQSDWRQFRTDFELGEDQHIDQIVGFLMGNGAKLPDGRADLNTKMRFQNSFAKMAQKLPDVLKNFADPNRPNFGKEVYDNLANSFIENKIEQNYQKALHQQRTGPVLA